MPLPTKRCEVVVTLKDKGRFVLSGSIKINPLFGMASYRVFLKKVTSFTGDLVGKLLPLSFLKICKFEFLTCLLCGKKVLFTAIPNITNTLNYFLIHIKSLGMCEVILQEAYPIGPPQVRIDELHPSP